MIATIIKVRAEPVSHRDDEATRKELEDVRSKTGKRRP